MAIRFKLRSSVEFDSVDIAPLPSISIRDLKSRILAQKNLKIFQDFDLVITDAVSGLEYEDEDFTVPSGSSVVIKRVPAGRSAPSVLPSIDVVENLESKHTDFIASTGCFPSVNVDIENFDDFGTDLCPVQEESLLDSDLAVDKVDCRNSSNANVIRRFCEPSIVRCQNLKPSDLSEAIHRGDMPCGVEGHALQTKLQQKIVELKNLDDVVNASSLKVERSDLPSELRCSLCKTIFKEAVMIPCCQHSFCEKCICSVLVEKAKCPKCFSSKSRVEDLLPNVSLRQAIEHFMESQVVTSGSDNILLKYAPDGESGIQVKEVSYAVSIHQREPVLPHSPSVTGKGSNQVILEPEYVPSMRNNRSAADNDTSATSTVKKKKGLWSNTTDGIGSFTAMSKYRKGDRTCYMCGSPDHFIRDCPAASGSFPMLQTGDAVFPGAGGMSAYGPSYWHGASFPNIRPYMNMYATPRMVPFDASMVPVTPFGVSSYVLSMYGGFPVPCGIVSMGSAVHPMVTGAEHSLSQAGFMEVQNNEKRRKLLRECPQRERHDGDSNECYYREHQQSYEYRLQPDKENGAIYSQEKDKQRPQKKRPRYEHLDEDSHSMDRRYGKVSSSAAGRYRSSCHGDATSSEMQEMSYSSSQHSKEKYLPHENSKKRSFMSSETQDVSDSSNHRSREKRVHHVSIRKLNERQKRGGSDSNHRSHESQKVDGTYKRRVETDGKRHSRRHHSMTQSGQELSSSEDHKRHKRKEKECGHSAKRSRHEVKTAGDLWSHERWEMVDGLNEDYRGEYHHHHKRKRVH